MAEETVRIVNRRDTTENWKNNNPILLEGEIGYDTVKKQFKIGDGITSWNNLDYYTFPIDYNNINNKPTIGEGLITLNFNGNKVGHFNVNSPTNETIDLLSFRPTFPLQLDKNNNFNLLYDDKLFMQSKENGKFTINLEYLASALKQYM